MVDVSAQGGCTITPINPTTLTAAGGILANGTVNVMIQCNCTDNIVLENVTWYDPNGVKLSFSDSVHITKEPDDTNIILVIPRFNDSYDGTYTCGRRDSIYPPGTPNASITLTIDSELMTMLAICMKQCYCITQTGFCKSTEDLSYM